MLKIVSFNIKCAWYGKTLNEVADLLKEIDGDIVGLQEVDYGTRRSLKHAGSSDPSFLGLPLGFGIIPAIRLR